MRRTVPGILALALLVSLFLAACAPAAQPATPTPTTAAKPAATTAAPAASPVATTPTTPPAATAPAPTAPAKTEKLKMGTPSTGLVELSQQMAKSKGFYAQENLEVEITRIAADVSIKALVAGEIDFVLALGSAVRAAAQGVPVKGLMANIDKPYHVLVVRPEIKEGKDLKGKSFAISAPADSPTQIIKAALKYYGLDPEKDATLVTLGGNPERVAGMKGGAVQATVLEPLYAVKAENEGMRVLLKAADIMDMPLAGMSTSDKMIKERPEVIMRALRATAKGMKYLKDPKNKEEVLQYMVTALQVTKEEATAAYPDIVRSLSDDGIPSEASLMREVQAAIDTGNARPNVGLADVFDFSFAKKVKEGG